MKQYKTNEKIPIPYVSTVMIVNVITATANYIESKLTDAKYTVYRRPYDDGLTHSTPHYKLIIEGALQVACTDRYILIDDITLTIRYFDYDKIIYG